MTEKLYTQKDMDAAITNHDVKLRAAVRTAHASEAHQVFLHLMEMSEEAGIWTQHDSEIIRFCAREIQRKRHRKQGGNG